MRQPYVVMLVTPDGILFRVSCVGEDSPLVKEIMVYAQYGDVNAIQENLKCITIAQGGITEVLAGCSPCTQQKPECTFCCAPARFQEARKVVAAG